MIRILIVAVAWFLAGVPLVSAKLIPHVITFNATTVNIDPDCAINKSFGYHTFPCDAKPGDSFFGFFTVEENLLTQEGVNLPGILGDFVVRIGDVIWDINSPSDFDGFRGPTLPGGGIPGCALCYEFDALSPGFNVVGGKIVGIWGGVYSDGDEPFVDFEYIYGPGGWGSVDSYRNYVSGQLYDYCCRLGAVIIVDTVALWDGHPVVCSSPGMFVLRSKVSNSRAQGCQFELHVVSCAGFSDARHGVAGDARRMAASEKRQVTKSRAG